MVERAQACRGARGGATLVAVLGSAVRVCQAEGVSGAAGRNNRKGIMGANGKGKGQPAVEVAPPDISAHRRGNTGIEFVTTFDSGRPGPHVVVNALTHGNEICGALALDTLFRNGVRAERGRLTLSFANFAAFARFDARRPFDSRFVDEDINRVWSDEVLRGTRRSWELDRARALLPVIQGADLLLDIHSMHLPCAPLMMCGMQEKSVALARRMGVPRHLVRDYGHDAGRRMRDYGAFDDPARPQTALLIECGQHWERSSVQVALRTTLHFLRCSGVVAEEWVQARLAELGPSPVEPQRVIEVSGPVTIGSPGFRFLAEFTGLEVIPEAGTLIALDGSKEIRTPYDECVLIMPGRNLAPGLSAVRFGRYQA